MPEVSRQVNAEHVLGGRYRLVRSIARGGMAQVWEAHDEILGRRVAVKVLYQHLATDESFLARFRREAIAAARLAHPNVVATYDTGVDGDVAWIVMELVDGRTLREELLERGAMHPSRVVHLGTQVADALDYAHRSGVVHRDVKPGNILLTEGDRVKVADFGIAKAASEAAEGASGSSSLDLTQSGAIVGTAKYLSPEQVNGEPVDGRSDVYALGVVLYEMLCGRPPFSGETEVALALQHLSAAPMAPRQVRAGIPRSLEAVVLRAMAKSPAQRFPTAGQLHTALLSVDLGPDDAKPVVVRQDTPPGGTPPTFAQTERSWMVPTVLIVVLAVTLGVVGALFARSDTGQRLLNEPESEAAGDDPLPVTRATAFDPQGDGREHDDELPRLTDGDPATIWDTERYIDRQFGGLKTGVGVLLELDGRRKLGRLEIESSTRGWSAQVFVADRPLAGAPPADWGEAAASKTGIDGPATFDLQGREGAAVLIWITDPGETSTVAVGEVRLDA